MTRADSPSPQQGQVVQRDSAHQDVLTRRSVQHAALAETPAAQPLSFDRRCNLEEARLKGKQG